MTIKIYNHRENLEKVIEEYKKYVKEYLLIKENNPKYTQVSYCTARKLDSVLFHKWVARYKKKKDQEEFEETMIDVLNSNPESTVRVCIYPKSGSFGDGFEIDVEKPNSKDPIDFKQAILDQMEWAEVGNTF